MSDRLTGTSMPRVLEEQGVDDQAMTASVLPEICQYASVLDRLPIVTPASHRREKSSAMLSA